MWLWGRRQRLQPWEDGGEREEKRSRVMAPSPQEVDDINKKLIILPPASSWGLARASHCSAHSPPPHTSYSPHPHKIMGWVMEERKVDGELCEGKGKETFCSPSRLAIDEYHQGSSTIDRTSFSLGLWWLLWAARTGYFVSSVCARTVQYI